MPDHVVEAIPAGIGDKQTRDLWAERNILLAKLDEEARENARLREEKARDDALYAQLDAVNAELHTENARLREELGLREAQVEGCRVRIADLERKIADNPRV